ncbi:3-oxo-5-alpha-steroid 4-dehydrogenase-domain-containing protein [Coniochaeta sp. 2T2.1]|nr:3-oxo-5-alpha-steroid 4-dehydrogenase-domain-containing protein [Coniochaeta sp. 2T2.1]
MALITGWYPPTKDHYNLLLFLWRFFGLFAFLQWPISWYGMGKTTKASRLNIPGRVAWLTMECPGMLTVLYHMHTLPSQPGNVELSDLPWQNKVLAALFVMHYIYRALCFPFMQPSMAPIHFLVWAFAFVFQVFNGTLIGSWLAVYGPTTKEDWAVRSSTFQFVLGITIFYFGLAANYYHDDELREIRRRETARQERIARREGRDPGTVERHYAVPQAGLFKYMLYPHYFVEWVEWTGFWIACGWGCAPAMMFVVNEIAAMLPRAVRGKWWYEEKFGKEKIKGRWAVVPGLI